MSNSACHCCSEPGEGLDLQFISVDVSCTGEYDAEEGIYRACDLPAFPAYPAFLLWPTDPAPPELEPDQGRGNAAFFHVSEATEGSYDEGYLKRDGKLKYRVAHWPTSTCYLRVWVKITTIPDEGSESVSIPAPVVWQGTGNPCIPNPSASAHADENVIYSAASEVFAPAVNGRIEVSMLKYSFLEDYEPDVSDPLNPQPSGYPDPLWEAMPP